MQDLMSLKPVQLDALREVANIGAGHAATALSQMTSQRIMVSVPRLTVRPLEEVPNHIGAPEEPVAAVLVNMLGDLTGRALLLFPKPTAIRVAELLMKKASGAVHDLGMLEQSAIKEAGNILSGAYMNALSDFMGMMLVPSVPSLVIDLNAAVLTTTYLNFGHDRDFVFCVETSFRVEGAVEPLRGHFLLLPDTPSLRAIFDAIRLT
jgi:chemotaxis protein CheC